METKWKFCQQLLNFHKFFLRLSTVQRSTMYTSIQSAISSVFFWGGGSSCSKLSFKIHYGIHMKLCFTISKCIEVNRVFPILVLKLGEFI